MRAKISKMLRKTKRGAKITLKTENNRRRRFCSHGNSARSFAHTRARTRAVVVMAILYRRPPRDRAINHKAIEINQANAGTSEARYKLPRAAPTPHHKNAAADTTQLILFCLKIAAQ